ncbi:MAG: hypothetical protein GXO07_06175 [Crenarchaeota archaeon]|nr:hypothetical protein [Thermoproteota archaeon]
MGFWPSKREIALYYLLKEEVGERFNLGEALSAASPYYPRKAALSIIRRLEKLGLIAKRGELEYELIDIDEWLRGKVREYLEARRRRYSSSS